MTSEAESRATAWVEYVCEKHQRLERVRFRIVQYPHMNQHLTCKGYIVTIPNENKASTKICIHNYVSRHFHRRSIYTDEDATPTQIINALADYIARTYAIVPNTLKIRIDQGED